MKIPSLNASFQPQVWIRDHAVDQEGAIEFDAAKSFLSLSARSINAATKSILAENNHELDDIAVKQGFVGGDGLHNGPYYVQIDIEDFLEWCEDLGKAPGDLAAIDEVALGKLRESLGMRADAVEVLMRGEIVDWRIGDGEGDDLSESQKQPWPVEVTRSSYGGVIMEFKAPDGTMRSVMVEVDNGNLKVLAYRDPKQSEQPDCSMHIMEDGTAVISASTTERGYMLYHEHGAHRVSGEIPQSFADEAATPSP